MTINEIKQAVNEGKTVCVGTTAYIVTRDNLNQWFIRCKLNNYLIGLTHSDGITLNNKPDAFFILDA